MEIQAGKHPNNTTSHTEVTMIKVWTRPRPSKNDYHHLARPAQLTIFGPQQTYTYMHYKIRLPSSSKCSCGQEDQVTEYVLWRCPLLALRRTETWRKSFPQQKKLSGNDKSKRQTANSSLRQRCMCKMVNEKNKRTSCT